MGYAIFGSCDSKYLRHFFLHIVYIFWFKSYLVYMCVRMHTHIYSSILVRCINTFVYTKTSVVDYRLEVQAASLLFSHAFFTLKEYCFIDNLMNLKGLKS